MINLTKFIEENLHIENKSLIADAIESAEYFCYKKGEIIIKVGDPLKMIGFIGNDGVVFCSYSTDAGKRIIDCISEGVGGYINAGTVLDDVAVTNMVAVTDLEVISFPIGKVEALKEKYPELYRLEVELTKYWSQKHFEMRKARLEYNAKDLYLWFCENYPKAAEVMKDSDIAAFLDMTPQSLSRAKKEIREER